MNSILNQFRSAGFLLVISAAAIPAESNEALRATFARIPVDTWRLSVDTTPVKGEVFVNGVSWGIAPQARQVTVGQYTLSFGEVAGYTRPADQTVSHQAQQVIGTYAQRLGTLRIDTTPVKGEVFVDGESWGTAPQSRRMAVGQHTVSFGEVQDYAKPADQSVTVEADQGIPTEQGWPGTKVTGTYVRHQGTLSVETTPIRGEVFVGGVSWGRAPQSKQLPTGTYTVSFGDSPGYTKPADQTITVEKHRTANILGLYGRRAPNMGTLSIDTSPIKGEVFVDGASWGIAPQSHRIPEGQHAVSFEAVSGYATPASQTVTIVRNQTTTVTYQYIPVSQEWGTLLVDTLHLKGGVQVDGACWGQAPQIRRVPAGRHLVSFGFIEGHITPADQTVMVRKDQITVVMGEYRDEDPNTAPVHPLAPEGTLAVDTTPVKGQFFLNGACWGTAPKVLIKAFGTYDVSFGDVDGYITPAHQVVELSNYESPTVVLGTYVPVPDGMGQLRVMTTPVKGEVKVDGTNYGKEPNLILLPVGQHVVSFGDVTGYEAPVEQRAVVGERRVTTVTGTYTQSEQPPIPIPTGATPPSESATSQAQTTPVKGEIPVDSESLNPTQEPGDGTDTDATVAEAPEKPVMSPPCAFGPPLPAYACLAMLAWGMLTSRQSRVGRGHSSASDIKEV